MLGARLLSLIQSHAGPLTGETLEDLITNDRTPSFRRLRQPELESRVALLFNNLAKWIGDPSDESVRREYEEMGATRFRESVPLSELVYAIILTKKHLRQSIREHGLVDFAGDRVAPAELLLELPRHRAVRQPSRLEHPHDASLGLLGEVEAAHRD